ncbi:MAG TPA: hypothetical protein VF242_14605 [Nitrososphaeraceae archaeon]|jgi:hypothetical protein
MVSDRILEYLVQRVEETGIGFDITLCVNGLVIYGNMIHSKQYYDLMIENMAKRDEITTNDTNEIKMVDSYREHYKQFMKDMIRQSEIDSLKYVHLAHAIIKLSSDSDPIITSAWRCKISSVDAFSLGYTTISKNDLL